MDIRMEMVRWFSYLAGERSLRTVEESQYEEGRTQRHEKERIPKNERRVPD